MSYAERQTELSTQTYVCLTPASGVSDIVWAKLTIVFVKLKDCSGKAGHAQSMKYLAQRHCHTASSHAHVLAPYKGDKQRKIYAFQRS